MTLPASKELEDFLTSALEAAFGAGKILRQYWGNLSQIEEKTHPGDLVTIADRESEKFIIELLPEGLFRNLVYKGKEMFIRL